MDNNPKWIVSLLLAITLPGLIMILLFGVFRSAQADLTNIYHVVKRLMGRMDQPEGRHSQTCSRR